MIPALRRRECMILAGCVLAPVPGRPYVAGTWQGRAVLVRTLRCERCAWWAIDRYDRVTLRRVGTREFVESTEGNAS